jgi:hypothetical protein
MGTAKLRVTRKWGGPAFGLGGVTGIGEVSNDYSIVVDGKVVGALPREGTVEVPIDPGRHTLQVRSPRHHSPLRTFDVSDGQEVTFSARHAVFWPQWVAAVIKKDRWISLKQQQGQSGNTLV